MGDIVKRGRILSPELQEKLYYNDHWGRDGGRDRETPKKYSWVCVRCGGEFIFKDQAMRCCTQSDWAMRNAKDEILTKGMMDRHFHNNGGYDYVDYIAGKNKKPKAVDFILVVEKEIRLLEKGIAVIGECQLKVEMEKQLAFFIELLPRIKELQTYDQVMEVINSMDYSTKEVFGINPDYNCDHCPFHCFINHHDKNHVCDPCPHHDCAEYLWQEHMKEWEEQKAQELI